MKLVLIIAFLGNGRFKRVWRGFATADNIFVVRRAGTRGYIGRDLGIDWRLLDTGPLIQGTAMTP